MLRASCLVAFMILVGLPACDVDPCPGTPLVEGSAPEAAAETATSCARTVTIEDREYAVSCTTVPRGRLGLREFHHGPQAAALTLARDITGVPIDEAIAVSMLRAVPGSRPELIDHECGRWQLAVGEEAQRDPEKLRELVEGLRIARQVS